MWARKTSCAGWSQALRATATLQAWCARQFFCPGPLAGRLVVLHAPPLQVVVPPSCRRVLVHKCMMQGIWPPHKSLPRNSTPLQVVAPTWRRRGAAGALLAAAEAAVGKWDERQALLHVYQDNEAAVQASSREAARPHTARTCLLCFTCCCAPPWRLALGLTRMHPPSPAPSALQLYRRQGYEVLAEEKGGLATLGRRPRYLMRKQW